MSYRVISDTEVAGGQPITQQLMQALKDNPAGSAAGDNTAPRITADAWVSSAGDYSIGGDYVFSDSGGSGITKSSNIRTVTKTGSYRIRLIASPIGYNSVSSTTYKAEFYHEGALIFSTANNSTTTGEVEAEWASIDMVQGDEIYCRVVLVSGSSPYAKATYRVGVDEHSAFLAGTWLFCDINNPDGKWAGT